MSNFKKIFFIIGAFLFFIQPASAQEQERFIYDTDLGDEWLFFHEQFIQPEEAILRYQDGTGQQVKLPHYFREHYDQVQMYGTYVRKMTIPMDAVGKRLAVISPFQYGSYRLYIDSVEVSSNGRIATNAAEHIAEAAPVVSYITPKKQELYVVMQLSNFHSIRGGFVQPIKIGDEKTIVGRYNSAIITYFFLNGSIFIIGLFLLCAWYFNRKDYEKLLLSLFCLIISIRSVFARPFIHTMTVLDVNWETAVKIEAICTLLATALALLLCRQWFRKRFSNKLLIAILSVLAVQGVITLATAPLVFQKTFEWLFFVPFSMGVYVYYIAIRSAFDGEKTKVIQLFGLTVVAMGAFHDLLVVKQFISGTMWTLYTIVFFVLLQVILISWQHAQKQKEIVYLNEQLVRLNVTLDEKVRERTVQLEDANERLLELASKDGLTGIANRHIFNKKIEELFEQTKQQDGVLSLLMMDLDSFKKYNDYYGHVLGDQLLQKVVALIEGVLPEGAIFARYGGEEFVMIMPETGADVLTELGNHLVKLVAQSKFEHCGQSSGIVTISAGGVTMSKDNAYQNTSQLIDAADQQLYQAKKAGRNMYVAKKADFLNM